MATYSTAALSAAAKPKPSMGDVVRLARGMSAAKQAVKSNPNQPGAAFLEPNSKQSTGYEPVATIGTQSAFNSEPKGTKVIARTKLSQQNLRTSKQASAYGGQ